MNFDEIWLGLHLAATMIVAACFLLSGAAKVRDVEATAETFRSLSVPAMIDHRWVHHSYAWIELVIGIALLVAPGWLWWPVTVVAAALLAVLTLLVARVLARADAVSCNCFGSRQPLTRKTLLRNVILFSIAVILVANSPDTASPVREAIPENLALLVSVVAATGAAIVLTALSSGGEHPLPARAETSPTQALPIPDVHFVDNSGEVIGLRSLVSEGAALVVFVKHGCGPCEEVVERLRDGDRIGGRVLVRLVERLVPDEPAASRSRLWDDGATGMKSLGMEYAPSALLLAADGTIPSNPVFGAPEIFRLVEAIEDAVKEPNPPDVTAVSL